MGRVGLLTLGIAAGLALLGTAARADDAADGKKIFNRVCMACHTDQANGPKRLGPTLFGVVGRHSGSIEGFRYSEANKSSRIVWTPENLDKYLTDPKAMVPGTIMAYAGLKKSEDRKEIIAYLQTLK